MTIKRRRGREANIPVSSESVTIVTVSCDNEGRGLLALSTLVSVKEGKKSRLGITKGKWTISHHYGARMRNFRLPLSLVPVVKRKDQKSGLPCKLSGLEGKNSSATSSLPVSRTTGEGICVKGGMNKTN